MMDNGGEREGDCRVPFLYGLFFISCLTGGIILSMWLIEAKGSQPWFPILALALIGFPWFFWALICCYSINKNCLTGAGGDKGRTSTIPRRAKPEGAGNADLGSRGESGKNGPVIVVDGGESPIASDMESEIPLNLSAMS